MPEITESTALSPDAVAAWKCDGFVIVRNVFSPDIMSSLSEEAWQLTQRRDLIHKHNLRCRFRETHDKTDCLWETFDPVIDLSPLCAQVTAGSQLLSILHSLYGEPACLFKDKLIFKQPGTKGYELHQDWISWPGFPRSFLTVLIPIDASTQDNGCTEVFAGYHHAGPLTPEDGNYHDLPMDSVDDDRMVPLVLDPGDIAIFDGFTPHRSAANQSDSWRRQLYLSYNAQSDGGDQRDAHYAEFHNFLRTRYAEHSILDTYFR